MESSGNYRYTPLREDRQDVERQRRRLARRRSGGLGLKGRLTLSFVALVSIAIGASCWLFASQSGQQLNEMMGEQARLVAFTLSRAAELPLSEHKVDALQQIGHELLNTRNVLYVAFIDAQKKPIALANRYVDFTWGDVSAVGPDALALHVVYPASQKTFGDYVDVFSPVMGQAPPIAPPGSQVIVMPPAGAAKPNQRAVSTANTMASSATPRLLGYVVVGVSLDREEAQLRWVNCLVGIIGAVVVLLSVPLAYALVYGIFKPIRQLVEATKTMSSGRFDVTLEIDRDDSIGDLADSFQEMVEQVRRQREDLASANGRLADANDKLGQTNLKLAEANNQLEVANLKLADSNRDLEEKVRQRTAQLETANQRLSAEIAEKEDFLRAVSHDLNAPLRNISGMASMLLNKNRERFDDDIIHRLERIQKNVDVETDLISELLELSRIKTQRQKAELVDLEAMVRDIGGVFEEDLRGKNIQLLLDTPLPIVTVEKARIRQVFQNLIDNAIKYMGEGRVREIHIGCHVRTEEAEFYVRDTGAGIDPDDIGKIFNVFRRGKGAATQGVAGKGVGLSSVKSIIQTYSGTIWVESRIGYGSTFRFTINGQYLGAQESSASGNPASREAA